jgi:hypothetical protein
VRINIYAEELTDEVELVTKKVTDDEFGTRAFHGIRVFLKSPDDLHHSAADDDRSAVTFWIPDRLGEREVIAELFSNMQQELSRVILGDDIADKLNGGS